MHVTVLIANQFFNGYNVFPYLASKSLQGKNCLINSFFLFLLLSISSFFSPLYQYIYRAPTLCSINIF